MNGSSESLGTFLREATSAVQQQVNFKSKTRIMIQTFYYTSWTLEGGTILFWIQTQWGSVQSQWSCNDAVVTVISSITFKLQNDSGACPTQELTLFRTFTVAKSHHFSIQIQQQWDPDVGQRVWTSCLDDLATTRTPTHNRQYRCTKGIMEAK